jgi:3-hexulose-6-phosphate synthase
MRELILEKLKSKKNLQVALDLTDIEKAIDIARNSMRAGADIIEAGTPLIKYEGYRALKSLKETIQDKALLLADMKTADAGEIEVEIAKKGGADIITVLGIMDDSTIESTVKRAKELEMIVEADLINVKNVVERAKELRDIGVDIVGLHVGIDVQKKRGITIADLREEIIQVSKLGIHISVAGGISTNNIKYLLDLPINIFVVGGFITKNADPYSATLQMVKIIKGKV